MAKVFVSGSPVGSNIVRFSSRMVEVANKKVERVKRTTCEILDNNKNVIASASVRRLSDDNDITDIGRKNAAKKALDSIENKEIKKELYGWYIPLMQQVERKL
tara:strand:- start:94352 stop:94660 length:309 start_codon:yes stop_codon:yes gene_type:complete